MIFLKIAQLFWCAPEKHFCEKCDKHIHKEGLYATSDRCSRCSPEDFTESEDKIFYIKAKG